MKPRGLQAGVARVVQRPRHVEALGHDDRAAHVEHAPRTLRRVPRVEAGVVGEDVIGRNPPCEQDPAHRPDLVVLDAAVVTGQQQLLDAARLVELLRGRDPVREHRRRPPVGHDLRAEHERDLRAGHARGLVGRPAAAEPHDQVRQAETDQREREAEDHEALHAAHCPPSSR